MHISKSIIIASAVVGLTTFSALADTTVGVSAGTSVSGAVTTPSIDIGSSANAKANANGAANANVVANADFGQVMSSVQGAKLGAAKIKALKKIKNVNIVKVSDMATAENKTTLDTAITKNKGNIASLRSALNSNASVKTALEDASVDVEAVVAANITSDGMLTVYVL